MSKKFDEKRTRKGAVVLGFCGFLRSYFKNNFLGIWSPKSGEKGTFTLNSCKSFNEIERFDDVAFVEDDTPQIMIQIL